MASLHNAVDQRAQPSLAEYLPFLLPESNSLLLSLHTRNAIYRLSERLPPVLRIALEFRLQDGETRVDLQQQFRRDDGVYPQLAAYLSPLSIAEGVSLRRFADELTEPSSVLSRHVQEVFLEFDLPLGGEQALPSIFVSLPDDPQLGREVAMRAIALLSPQASTGLQTTVECCIGACASDAFVSGLGFMLGRVEGSIRINVKRLLPTTVERYLSDVGYAGDCRVAADHFTAALYRADRVTLALDFVARNGKTQIDPRIGMECFFDEQPNADPLWEGTLAELRDANLCRTDKLQALLALPADTLPSSTKSSWPLELIAQSAARPEDHFSAFVRKLYHLKLSGEPGEAWEAKAYLGASHEWIIPAPIRLWQAPGGFPRRAPRRDEQTSDGISAATEQGIDLLLRRQMQSGLWRDFKTPSISDEWVSAFIAVNLLDTGCPAVDVAAHECAAALLRTQRSDGGWGYWMHQAPDADSTAWVLHLLRRLCFEQNQAFERGMVFLRGHCHADGGVFTYADHEQLAWSMGTAAGGSFDGWEQAHVCVTAAAAPLLPETALTFLRREQRDGRWSGYWWHGDAYPTGMAVSALAGNPEHAESVHAAQRWAAANVLLMNGSSGLNAFELAFYLRTLCATHADRYAQEIRLAIDLLLRLQTDGGWLPAARMRIPLPSAITWDGSERVHLDYRGSFTTAAVVSALTIAQRASQIWVS